MATQQQDRRANPHGNPNDRSWLLPGQRAWFVHKGTHKAGNVKEVYPEPPYAYFVKVRLDDGQDAYVPFTSVAEGMGAEA